jgi:hypothetical protein
MVKDQLKCKYVSDVLAVLEGPMYVCAEVMFVFGTTVFVLEYHRVYHCFVAARTAPVDVVAL